MIAIKSKIHLLYTIHVPCMLSVENNLKVSIPLIDQAEPDAAATHRLGINIYVYNSCKLSSHLNVATIISFQFPVYIYIWYV